MKQGIMKVISFQNKTKPLYNFIFNDAKNVYQLGCSERAMTNFYNAENDLCEQGMRFFHMDGYVFTLKKISFGGTVDLSFFASNQTAGVVGLFVTKKSMNMKPEVDKDSMPICGSIKNNLIQAIEEFKIQCERYIQGNREQTSFQFSGQSTDNDTKEIKLIGEDHGNRID